MSKFVKYTANKSLNKYVARSRERIKHRHHIDNCTVLQKSTEEAQLKMLGWREMDQAEGHSPVFTRVPLCHGIISSDFCCNWFTFQLSSNTRCCLYFQDCVFFSPPCCTVRMSSLTQTGSGGWGIGGCLDLKWEG